MKTQILSRSLSLASVSLGLCLITGCSTLKTINVSQDAALAGASVAVDIVPETDKNAAIETCSVRDYWKPGSALRHGQVATLRFGQGQPATQSVTKNWQALGAKKVVVLADLPGVFQDAPGDADARRKIIPVGKAATVTVRVSPTGLSVESQ
jgi:hypothetical protein